MKLKICLAIALAQASAFANRDLSGLREVFGCFFDARTGSVVDSRWVRQPYTFENAILFDFRLETISAGEAANAMMRNPIGARKLISDDIERGVGTLQRMNGD